MFILCHAIAFCLLVYVWFCCAGFSFLRTTLRTVKMTNFCVEWDVKTLTQSITSKLLLACKLLATSHLAFVSAYYFFQVTSDEI